MIIYKYVVKFISINAFQIEAYVFHWSHLAKVQICYTIYMEKFMEKKNIIYYQIMIKAKTAKQFEHFQQKTKYNKVINPTSIGLIAIKYLF